MTSRHNQNQATTESDLTAESQNEARRQELLKQLAETFEQPETAGIDWDLLREGKRRAWPIR
jgi:hypothetical protein